MKLSIIACGLIMASVTALSPPPREPPPARPDPTALTRTAALLASLQLIPGNRLDARGVVDVAIWDSGLVVWSLRPLQDDYCYAVLPPEAIAKIRALFDSCQLSKLNEFTIAMPDSQTHALTLRIGARNRTYYWDESKPSAAGDANAKAWLEGVRMLLGLRGACGQPIAQDALVKDLFEVTFPMAKK